MCLIDELEREKQRVEDAHQRREHHEDDAETEKKKAEHGIEILKKVLEGYKYIRDEEKPDLGSVERVSM